MTTQSTWDIAYYKVHNIILHSVSTNTRLPPSPLYIRHKHKVLHNTYHHVPHRTTSDTVGSDNNQSTTGRGGGFFLPPTHNPAPND